MCARRCGWLFTFTPLFVNGDAFTYREKPTVALCGQHVEKDGRVQRRDPSGQHLRLGIVAAKKPAGRWSDRRPEGDTARDWHTSVVLELWGDCDGVGCYRLLAVAWRDTLHSALKHRAAAVVDTDPVVGAQVDGRP
jgi:hypothetical protein